MALMLGTHFMRVDWLGVQSLDEVLAAIKQLLDHVEQGQDVCAAAMGVQQRKRLQ
jgi:hypothetical protein